MCFAPFAFGSQSIPLESFSTLGEGNSFLEREAGQKIYLYKQGVFWTAYEHSALILSLHKAFKNSVIDVKRVNQQLVCM